MLRRLTTTTAAVLTRHFSTLTVTAATKPFSKIPWKHRSKAIQESQKALTDYLHTTRSLPFLYAEHIAVNSPHSLSKMVSEIPFSPHTFTNSFERFLRYHPVNELDFFLESIGLTSSGNGEKTRFFPPNTYFLADWEQFNVVCALAGMGFPWSRLGLLLSEERLVFGIDPGELERRVDEIRGVYGFNCVGVIGICLAFPRVLYSGMEGLLSDLRRVFVDCDLAGLVEGSVEGVLEVCRKIQLFYEFGCEMGKVGDVMGRNKSVLVEYSEEVLVEKIRFFCELGVGNERIGPFLLLKPEIFGFDLESRVISVSGLLEHFGMRRDELKSLKLKYPYVFGRNRIGNLPHVMRAMNLGEWFFEKMKNGDHFLLDTYTIRHTDENLDKHYTENLLKLQAKRTHAHAIKKLNFLHRVGFGENKFAVKALVVLNSSSCQLQKRFNFLLRCGIEYSKLCAMVSLSAKFLNQQESVIEKKLEFLCKDMGSSLDYLDVFPAYLCYDLEKRIKPRYKLHKWILEQGYCEKKYSVSTIIASSEKTFIARISRIHPSAAKEWKESSPVKDG